MVRDTLLRERLMATLSGLFGLLALVLSATGIYGVLSYLVVRRRQEIGVRLALGATRSDIVRMVAAQSLGWVGAGLGAGVLLAVLSATAARSMLFGLAPTDPVALVAAAATLAATGAVATVIPAFRAARLHPTSALRRGLTAEATCHFGDRDSRARAEPSGASATTPNRGLSSGHRQGCQPGRAVSDLVGTGSSRLLRIRSHFGCTSSTGSRQST